MVWDCSNADVINQTANPYISPCNPFRKFHYPAMSLVLTWRTLNISETILSHTPPQASNPCYHLTPSTTFTKPRQQAASTELFELLKRSRGG